MLNGFTQRATFPATSQQVWRYQPASNDFASEANDPGVATTSSYYVSAAGSIYRITPPFAPSPFTPELEKIYLPGPESIASRVRQLVANRADG